jgi:ankyrin repeat protein
VPAPTFERLLEAGADVNYDPFLLLQACIADPTDHAIAVASVLIAGGADVNGVCDGLSPSLLTTTAWSDSEREISVTPLNAACICEHKEIIKLLLAAGADANLTPQAGGTTPLYEASLHGNAEIVQLLLDAGAEVDASGSMVLPPACLAIRHDIHTCSFAALVCH